MDESFQELENELRALRPQQPSVVLRARIERELASPVAAEVPRRHTPATTLRSWKWVSWESAAAVAAGVVLAMSAGLWQGRIAAGGVENPPPSVAANPAANPAAASAQYVPVSAASVLYDLQDEGVVTVQGDQAARQARFRFVDTYTWKNPATNASLSFSVPRDEVRVVPVPFQ